jgi:hypothetical protein
MNCSGIRNVMKFAEIDMYLKEICIKFTVIFKAVKTCLKNMFTPMEFFRLRQFASPQHKGRNMTEEF